MSTATVTSILSILTIVGGALVVGYFLLFIAARFSSSAKRVLKKVDVMISKKALLIGFIVSLIATCGSLYYSDVAGYTPCKLCWYQRIMMYPQVLIFAIALWKDDIKIASYALAMSVVGGALALYHYLLQVGVIETTSCSVVGYSITCSERFLLNYGYVTIPMMALTVFLLIAVSMNVLRKKSA